MKNNPLQLYNKILMYSFYGLVTQLFFCGLVLASGPSHAQKNVSVKETYASFSFKSSDLVSVFEQIEKITNYSFTYDKRELDEKIKISGKYRDASVYQVLMDLSRESNLGFRQFNNNIIVSKYHKQKKPRAVDILISVEISGKITDETGQGLPGVSVVEKGTTNGATTNLDGYYKLSVAEEAVLIVSIVGYKTQEVRFNGRSIVDIQMEADIEQLQEVVVMGYGTQESANVTSAIGSVKASKFKDIPITNLEDGLTGQLAGVQIVQNSGQPGESAQINIRGIATLTAGTDPLIVIDGIPMSPRTGSNINESATLPSVPTNILSTISPSDIASIEVLKDAASAAIYGSRASNGVIIVTTKKGQAGKPKFQFNAFYGTQSVSKRLDLTGAYDFATLVADARNNYYLSLDPANHSVNDPNDLRQANAGALGGNTKKVIIPDYVQPYLDGETGLTDTDWQDAIFRSAPIQSYQLSAAGGTENTTYYISGNYFDQEGIVLGSDFKRYTLRLNLETELSKKLKLGTNLSPSFSSQNGTPSDWHDNPIMMMINMLPVFSPYNADGTIAISTQANAAIGPDQAIAENPVAFTTFIDEGKDLLNLNGYTYLEYELMEGLTAKTSLGINYGALKFNYYRPSFIGAYRDPAPTVASGVSSTATSVNWISESILRYSRNFQGGHNLNLLGVYSFQKETEESNRVTATGFPNDVVPTLSAGVVNGGTSIKTEWTLISYILRANYAFDDKYLLMASIRRDGSSRFGANNKWAMFPSVSAGWRVSSENFFPDNGLISDLKLRASWGLTGNNLIGNYGSQALLGTSNAILGGSLQSGLAPTTSPNEDLSWEQTQMFDVGLDVDFFEGKLLVGVDYYRATTKDMLLNVPVPAHSGFVNSLQNIGRVRNAGVELSINGRYELGDFQISHSFNVASNKNEVLELGPGQDQLISGGRSITVVGGEIGAHYGYRTDGIFLSQEQLDNTPHLSSATIGDYIYRDSNGDGQINSDDRVVLGSFWPDYTAGFSTNVVFKGFDLSFLLQSVQGVILHNRQVSVNLYNPEGWGNGAQDYFDNRYTPDNPNPKYARANPVPKDNGFWRETDILHDDASFVRVRNITLGYSLPVDLAGKIGLQSGRFYFTAKDPITSTDYRGFNPEATSSNPLRAGVVREGYAREKSFVFGVNLTF